MCSKPCSLKPTECVFESLLIKTRVHVSLCILQPIKDGEMPPYDAMETILPEYRYIFTEPSINHDREPGRTRGTTMAPTTRQTR